MFSAFSYVTGPNQRNLAQKVQKKKVGRFGVTRPYQIHTSRESGIDRHFKRNVYFAHLADVRISFVEISVPPQKDCITSVYLMLLMKTSNLYSKEM